MTNVYFGSEFGWAVDCRCSRCMRFIAWDTIDMVFPSCDAILEPGYWGPYWGPSPILVGACKRHGRVLVAFAGFY